MKDRELIPLKWQYSSMISRPISRQDIKDIWAQVARIREGNGDKEGAKRARRNVKIMSGLR